jgi:hypothetical protein
LRSILPPSYEHRHGHAERVELSSDRQLRTRNKLHYRLSHWPIWIWVFLIAPGPITFKLFSHGPDREVLTWLAVVVVGTGIAGLFGKLPGVEPAPYILRFNEDRPNPLYRRICYTLAWSEVVSYALLNVAGLVDAIVHGTWRMRAIYDAGYLPIAGTMWVLGAIGWLPRVGRSTKREGQERRYFYGSVWAACVAQPVLWFLWAVLPVTRISDIFKLVVFLAIFVYIGNLSRRGLLPRTRPILPGETVVAD